MTVFFDVAYAGVIFMAFGLAGVLPGYALGFVVPRKHPALVVPALAIALAGWIWAGWLDATYGISRFGLVVFTGIGAAGFVYGWSGGLRAGRRARFRRRRAAPAPPGGRIADSAPKQP